MFNTKCWECILANVYHKMLRVYLSKCLSKNESVYLSKCLSQKVECLYCIDVIISGIAPHRCLHCLLNRLFRCRSKKTSKLCVTRLCEGNTPVTSGFSSQRTSNDENVSIWWCHPDLQDKHNQNWSVIPIINIISYPSGAETGIFQENYRKVSNIRRTKSQNLNASRLIL